MESPKSTYVAQSADQVSFTWLNDNEQRVIFKVSVNDTAVLVKPKCAIVKPNESVDITIVNRKPQVKPKVHFDSFLLEDSENVEISEISEFLKNNKNTLKKISMQRDLVSVFQESNIGLSSPMVKKEEVEESNTGIKAAIIGAVAVAAAVLILK